MITARGVEQYVSSTQAASLLHCKHTGSGRWRPSRVVLVCAGAEVLVPYMDRPGAAECSAVAGLQWLVCAVIVLPWANQRSWQHKWSEEAGF